MSDVDNLSVEIQRLIALVSAAGVRIDIIAATPQPLFAGAGAGSGIVNDPGGAATGLRYLDDTGGFSVPAGGGGGGGFPAVLGYSL